MNLDRVIVAVEGGGPTGGAERVAFDTIKLLSNEGHKVTILSSAKEIDSEYVNLPNVDYITLDLPLHFNRFFAGSKPSMLFNLTEDREMKALFDRVLGAIDTSRTIFHAHGYHNFFTQACLHVATGLQMKTVLTCHDYGIACPNSMLFNYPNAEICTLDPLSGACRKSACMGVDAVRLKQLRFARAWANEKLYRVPQKLDKILAVSEFERAILQKHFGSKAKIETLCNPVDPAATVRQSPSRSQDFLWVGRMTLEKDATTPARVCHGLGVPLTIVGDGPLQSEVSAANPDAKFLGWLPPQEVKEIQCRARALIMSSKCYETASLVVLECLAAGIPCVVPSMSAATSWIDDGVNGLFFEIGNEASLREALVRLSDDEFVERLSVNAFEKYWRSPFTLDHYNGELMRYYSEALGL